MAVSGTELLLMNTLMCSRTIALRGPRHVGVKLAKQVATVFLQQSLKERDRCLFYLANTFFYNVLLHLFYCTRGKWETENQG